MLAERNCSIAYQWLAAFNAHDVEALLALYADDAQHYSPKLKARQPGTKGLIRGKDELRAWWADAFQRLPSLNYEVVKLTANDTQVFMEYVRHVADEENLQVAEVLEVSDGRIVASRVYHG